MASCDEVFGESEDDVVYIAKKLPGLSVRTTMPLWSSEVRLTSDQLKRRKVIMKLYLRLLTYIAATLCGSEAAGASIHTFAKWLAPTEAKVADSDEMILISSARAILSTKKNSIERRTLRAVMCASVPYHRLTLLSRTMPRFSISRPAYSRAIDEYEHLVIKGNLRKEPWSRARVKNECADAAIKFILAADNVAFLSWGSKRIQRDGVTYEVPSIARKRAYRSCLVSTNLASKV